MKVLVASLLDSLPALGNVAMFLLFIILLFSILGLQLFNGLLENRCRLTSDPIDGFWQADPSTADICGGNLDCPTG